MKQCYVSEGINSLLKNLEQPTAESLVSVRQCAQGGQQIWGGCSAENSHKLRISSLFFLARLLSFLPFFQATVFDLSLIKSTQSAVPKEPAQTLESLLKSQFLMLPTVILKSRNTKFSEKVIIHLQRGARFLRAVRKSKVQHKAGPESDSPMYKGKSLRVQGKEEVHGVAERSRQDLKEKEMPESTTSRGNRPTRLPKPSVFLLDILSMKQAAN